MRDLGAQQRQVAERRQSGLRALFETLLPESGVEIVADLPDSIEIVRRVKAGASYRFYLNYHAQPQNVRLLKPGRELLSDKAASGGMNVNGFDLLIIKES